MQNMQFWPNIGRMEANSAQSPAVAATPVTDGWMGAECGWLGVVEVIQFPNDGNDG